MLVPPLAQRLLDGPSMATARILIADGDGVSRAATRDALAAQFPALRILEAASLADVDAALQGPPLAVALLRGGLPPLDVFGLAEHLRATAPRLPLILHPRALDPVLAVRAVNEGFAGFALPDPPRMLLEVVERVLERAWREAEEEHDAALARQHAELLDALGEAVFAATPSGHVLYWNAAAEALFGWSAEDVLGKRVTDVLVPPSEFDALVALLLEMANADRWSGVVPARRADGRELRVQLTTRTLRHGPARVAAVVAVARDAGTPALADELWRKRALLDAQLDVSTDVVILVIGETVTAVSGRVAELLRTPPAEALIGKHVSVLLDAIVPHVRDPAVVERLRADPHLPLVELPLDDGRVLRRQTRRFLSVRGEMGWISVYRDVTAQRRMEEELRRRERLSGALSSLRGRALVATGAEPLLRDALEVIGEALDTELGEVLELQAAGGCETRARRGEIAKARCDDLTCHQTLSALGALPAAVRIEEDPRPCAAAWCAANGIRSGMVATIPGKTRAFGAVSVYSRVPRTFGDHELGFLQGCALVLSAALERLRSDEELRASEARWRLLVEQLPDGVALVQDDRYVLVNRAFAAIFGRTPEAVIGDTVFYRPPPPPPGASPSAAVESIQLVPWRGRVHLEATTLTVEYAGRPASLLLLRDVTDRRRVQAQLMQADRMVSVGTLAAGIAHELNNPLAYVLANLEFASRALGAILPAATAQPEEVKVALREALDGAARMKRIIRDLKVFSHVEVDEQGATDVVHSVQSAINIAWPELKHRAEVVRDLRPVHPVLANEGRLTQVFVNLLVNAAQAIDRGVAAENRVTVRTREDDQRVYVEVSDTGRGIAPEHVSRIFDPFFTTKRAGEGTGLGLSVCLNIVRELGGGIDVESTPHVGSTFRVWLPIPTGPLKAKRPPSVPAIPAVSAGRARVLLVDDEPYVLTALRRVLEPQHDVHAVPSGQEALALIQAGERFDVILCDLMMPGTTGADVYETLATVAPELVSRLVFISGGAVTPAMKEFVSRTEIPLLEKPLQPDALRAFVASRLTAAAR